MNRFLYYLIIINMIANIVASVPRILLAESTNGAITSMILGTFAGLFITIVTIKFYAAYPKTDLMELLNTHTRKWFSILALLYFAINWYIAGLITLITFTFILIRFLTPEMPLVVILFSLLVVISGGILIKTKSILFMFEVVIVLFCPLIIFLLVKTGFNNVFVIDYVRIAMMHINEMPSYSALTATSYLYIGIVNLAVFNKFFSHKKKITFLPIFILTIVGVVVLGLTYFAPIGVGGFDEIERLIYPWISTSDSIRMKFGLVERLLFIFLLVFLAIAIMSIIIHWHGASKLLQGAFSRKWFNWKGHDLSPFLYIILFSLIALIAMINLTENQLFKFTQFFFNLLPSFFGISMFVFFTINRRAKR